MLVIIGDGADKPVEPHSTTREYEGAVAVVAEDAGYLEAIKNESPGRRPQDER